MLSQAMPAKNKPVAASAADAPVVKQEKAGKRFRLNYGKSGAVESLLIDLAGPIRDTSTPGCAAEDAGSSTG